MPNGADVLIKLGADGTQFEQVFRDAFKMVERFATSGNLIKAGLGAVFVSAIVAIKREVEAMEELNHELVVMKNRTGAPVESLQLWNKEIEKFGGGLEDVDKLLEKIEISREKAIQGGPEGKMAKAFAGMGINYNTLLNTPSASELFAKIQGNKGGDMGSMLDVFGPRLIKYSGIFREDMEKAKNALAESGKFIDEHTSQLIEWTRTQNKQMSLMSIGDTPGSKGRTAAAFSGAWFEMKSMFVLVGNSIEEMLHGKSPSKAWNTYVDRQTEFGRRGGLGNAGSLTPEDYAALEKRLNDRNMERSRLREEVHDKVSEMLPHSQQVAKAQSDLATAQANFTKAQVKGKNSMEYLGAAQALLLAQDKLNKLHPNQNVGQLGNNPLASFGGIVGVMSNPTNQLLKTSNDLLQGIYNNTMPQTIKPVPQAQLNTPGPIHSNAVPKELSYAKIL